MKIRNPPYYDKILVKRKYRLVKSPFEEGYALERIPQFIINVRLAGSSSNYDYILKTKDIDDLFHFGRHCNWKNIKFERGV